MFTQRVDPKINEIEQEKEWKGKKRTAGAIRKLNQGHHAP
jgi:hypothetical protein